MAADGNGNGGKGLAAFGKNGRVGMSMQMKTETVVDGGIAGDFTYYPRTPGRVRIPDGIGVCDDTFTNLWQRLAAFRFGVAGFRAVRNADTGALEIVGVTLTLYTSGVQESGANAGLGATSIQTTAETNAMKGGGLATAGSRFLAFAALVQPMAGWGVPTGDDAIGGTRGIPSWLRGAGGGTDYVSELQARLVDGISLYIANANDQACDYDAGPMASYLGPSTNSGFNPMNSIPGQMLYFSTPETSGAKQDNNAIQLNLTLTDPISVDSNVANPTVAGTDVIIPFRVSFIGVPICGTGIASGGVCVPNGQVSEAQLEAAAARALQKMLAQNGG